MCRHRRSWSVLVAAALLAWLGLSGAGGEARAAGLLVADGGFGGRLEIREQMVDVVIDNGVAVTTVEQTFVNTENRTVEALYTFPVPKGASVANFTMWINGQEMVGEVLEKQRAREIYDSYKRPRDRKFVDPGLLEQVDYKTFEMRIFPITARAEQRIRLTYYQELDFDHDWATYVYPLATVTQGDMDQRVTGRHGLTLRVKSEVPIAELQSPSHGDAFVVAKHAAHFAEASFEVAEGSLARDVVLAYRTERPRTGLDVITSRPEGEDGYFMLTLTAGQELAKLDASMDYVFVLDISGSMEADGKLDASRNTVAAFVKELGEGDRFEVISFNVQPYCAFGQLMGADEQAKSRATTFLQSQEARGGTVLLPAMTTAYRYADPQRTLNVVIFSDGMTEQGDRAALIRSIGARPEQTRVFCVGVGNEINRPLLSQLAEQSGGLAAFLSQGDDFQRQARAFQRKLRHPVAEDVSITFADGQVYDLEPTRLGNLYHGSPLRLYGRYRSGGLTKVTVRGTLQGQPLEKTVQVQLPTDDGGHAEIERMWAWHRVQRLLKEADASGSRTGVLDEIVTLGEAYSIVTEYTSFIVLENDAEYQRWQIDRRNLLRLKRDLVSQQRVRDEMARLREQALTQLGPNKGQPQLAMNDVEPALQPKVDVTADRQAQPDPQQRGVDLNLGAGAMDPVTVFVGLGAFGLLVLCYGKGGASRKRRAADL